MGKEVIFSVAGSGKTSYLIEKLNTETRTLIVVYTQANFENIQKRIIGKFGYIPPNIACYTYFTFLFSWGIKPFNIINYPPIKRIDFDNKAPQKIPKINPHYYLYKDSIYHYRLYDFIEENSLTEKLVSRIERFFDEVFIDEVQDYAGNDFDFLMSLSSSSVLSLTVVGDFYQHIYDTSRNGSKNKNLHKNFEKYRKRFMRFTSRQLNVCYRCPEAVCRFISTNLGIHLIHNPHNDRQVNYPRLIECPQMIKLIIEDDRIPKLVYANSETFDCWTITWGKSKGLEYEDVCVVLNKTTSSLYKQGKLLQLASKTLNKFYVACSRSKGNLYFIEEHHLPKKVTKQL